MALSQESLYALLDDVPDYQAFLTVDEMRASSQQLADDYPDVVSLITLGASRGGTPIEALKIGDGEKVGFMVGLPHPNEPIGAMMLEYLARKLAEDDTLRESLDYTWYLIKAIDIDGTRLNEGWFKGPFTITNYAREFYRPPSQHQVEWTFPVSYKTYEFNAPLPETQVWMKLIEQHPPDFIYSLHNAGFGGVYLYISHDLQTLYPPFYELVKHAELPLNLGEPEVPYAKQFSEAVFGMIGLSDNYDFMEAMLKQDPAPLLKAGCSSYEYARRFADPLFLVCEMPYFYNANINDLSPTSTVRREATLAGIKKQREIWTFIKDTLTQVEDSLTVESLFRDAIVLYSEMIFNIFDSQEQHALNTPEMAENATRAELFDNQYTKRFYALLFLGTLVRMLNAEIVAQGETPTLNDALTSAQSRFDEEAAYLEDNIDYSVIPIRKLVQVQLGTTLLSLDHHYPA